MIHLQETARGSVAAMGELQGIAARLRDTALVLKTDVDRFTVGLGVGSVGEESEDFAGVKLNWRSGDHFCDESRRAGIRVQANLLPSVAPRG